MVYRLVYGVQASVWCTGWCMVYRLVYGIQAGVWGLGWCMVYRLVYGVQAGVWYTGWCMGSRLVYGVQAGVWCTGWCMGKHIMQTPAHTYITHQHTPDTPTFKVAVACLLVVFADVRLVLPTNSTGDLS